MTAGTGPRIRIGVEDLTVRYARSPRAALSGVSFATTTPVTFLVGQNGAGKTTLFRAMLGSVPVTTGRVVGAGGARLGYCPQAFDLPPRVRLGAYLEYVAWLKGVWRGRAPESVRETLAKVGLADRSDDRLGELSGGMQRRVGLAHALVGEPDVVLLDEPLAGVDPIVRREMRDVLAEVSGGCTLLVSTHLVEDIALMEAPTSVVVLRAGSAAFAGPREDLPMLTGLETSTETRRAQELALLALMGGQRA